MQQNPFKKNKKIPFPDSKLMINMALTLNPSDPFVMGWANDHVSKEPVYLKYQKPVESKRKQRKRMGK